jgi:hypothetical protein
MAFEKNAIPQFAIAAFLSVVKVINQNLYAELKVNASKWNDIDEFLNFPNEENTDKVSRVLFYIS